MSHWDIQNNYWYCTKCNKFTQETYAAYCDCKECGSRLKSCCYLLHMCKNYRNLVDDSNSLSELDFNGSIVIFLPFLVDLKSGGVNRTSLSGV